MQSDQEYMQRALCLAEKGQYSTRPNPCVGCVLVQDNQIIGEGWHQVAGGPHAEIVALQQAGMRAQHATAYVTLEPCSHQGKTGPCVQALIDAQVVRVVIAMQDPNPKVNGQGIAKLQQAGIQVDVSLCQARAMQINQGFCYAMQHQRPYVRLKQAMSIDARIALANGQSQWITSPASRLDVQRLRARSAAIVTGVSTVIADDPKLTVRIEGWPVASQPETAVPHPVRVIVDSQLRIPVACQIVQSAATVPTWVCCAQNTDSIKQKCLQDLGVRIVELPIDQGHVSLSVLWDYLYQQHCYDVMIESGATLASNALQQQWVNEWWLYMGNKILGQGAQSVIKLPEVSCIADAMNPTLIDVMRFDQDVRLRYQF